MNCAPWLIIYITGTFNTCIAQPILTNWVIHCSNERILGWHWLFVGKLPIAYIEKNVKEFNLVFGVISKSNARQFFGVILGSNFYLLEIKHILALGKSTVLNFAVSAKLDQMGDIRGQIGLWKKNQII